MTSLGMQSDGLRPFEEIIVEPDGLSQIGKINSQKKTQVITLLPQECRMHNPVRLSGPLAHKRKQTLDLHFFTAWGLQVHECYGPYVHRCDAHTSSWCTRLGWPSRRVRATPSTDGAVHARVTHN